MSHLKAFPKKIGTSRRNPPRTSELKKKAGLAAERNLSVAAGGAGTLSVLGVVGVGQLVIASRTTRLLEGGLAVAESEPLRGLGVWEAGTPPQGDPRPWT